MTMFNLFALFILIGHSSLSWGIDKEIVKLGYDPRVDLISDKYQAGQFLIYDCEEGHWVCVLEEYFKNCQSNRSKEQQLPDELRYSCAPIGSFPNKISCFQRILFLTSQHHGNRFCIKDQWKLKAVN